MTPRVALLPVYLELYDRALPELLTRQMTFLHAAAEKLHGAGMEVITLPVCRTLLHTQQAVAEAERHQVCGMITLHLAYSPSLEIAPALVSSALPVLLWDTTPRPDFGQGVVTNDVLENHGIHGVQDLANVLRRERKTFHIVAGSFEKSDRHCMMRWAQAAATRQYLQQLRVARIGEPFAGMGDFAISEERLRETVGPTTVPLPLSQVAAHVQAVTEAEVTAECESDLVVYDSTTCEVACLARSNRTGLGVRRAVEEVGAAAFSMHFGVFDRALGTPTVPFLEASKIMARGGGYAGEGDVLTASLVAALNYGYGVTTFTEMFCPDWEGGRIFMSHMGECNPALAEGRPRLEEKAYGYGPVENPAVLLFPLRPGPATLVNLAPGPEESMALLAANVTIEAMPLEPNLPGSPHFWIAPPQREVARFLECYSEAGGTHHLALTPGVRAEELRMLAQLQGWEFQLLSP